MRARIDRAALGPFLRDEAQRAREALAATIFALDAIKSACTEAAGKGFSTLTIKPPAPLDLARTEAGARAREWLTEQGTRAVWENRMDADTGETFPVLVVSWD